MPAEAAHAEVPAPPPPPAPRASPEKRALPVPGEGGEDPPPEPKRRRACIAALDGVTCAARPAEASGDADGASFSFHHARGGFVVALETTPKFGSFNPPAAAEQAGLDVKPAPPDREGSPEADEQFPVSSSVSGADEDGGKEENSPSPSVGVEAGGQGQHTDKNDDPVDF